MKMPVETRERETVVVRRLRAEDLDTIGVHPDFQGRGVGAALLDQLRTDLMGLGVPRLQTEVSWDDPRLLSFFHHEGLRPAERLCLDLDLERERIRPGSRERNA